MNTVRLVQALYGLYTSADIC